MISIKQIKIKNFLSHSDTVIDFKEDHKLLIDGKSGSGKSSIVEALIWGLYGVARVDNRNLVKHGTKASTVILTFQEGDITYKVERGTTDKAKNTLSVYISSDSVNFKPIERTGLKDIQDWIENELLHASYTLFINSIAYPQDNINNFVKQTASKRKDLLLEIANIKDFDKYYTRAKEELYLKDEALYRVRREIEQYYGFMNVDERAILDEDHIKDRINSIETILVADKEKLETLRAKENLKKFLEKEVKILAEEEKQALSGKEELDFKVIGLSLEIKKIKDIDIDLLKKKVAFLDKVTKERDELAGKIEKDYKRTMKMNALMADKPAFHDYDKDISELKNRLSPILKESQSCPAGDNCPFAAPMRGQVAFLQEQIAEKQQKEKDLSKAMNEYQDKVAALDLPDITETERNLYRKLCNDIKEVENVKIELDRAETKVSSLPKLEKEVLDTEKEIERIFSRGADIEDKILENKSKLDKMGDIDTDIKVQSMIIERSISELTNLKTKILFIEKSKENIQLYKKRVETCKIEESKLSESIKSLSAIKEAFGNKGLKTVAVDYLIPRLEDKINEILAQLSDFRVRLDTQKLSASGEETIEGLYIFIKNENGEELDFNSFSGGEKVKISIAISEALATLQRCGFRILDENIISLDKESTESLTEVLIKIQKKFPQMICISHLLEVKDIFSERINIIKIGNTSIIEK